METISAIAFAISCFTNCDLTVGLGMTTTTIQPNPLGIVRLSTTPIEREDWRLNLVLSHQSSIPDVYDTYDTDMASIEFTVKLR
jgi:hypothetical protein